MSWYVGGEDRYYDAPDDGGPCACSEAGLLECFCSDGGLDFSVIQAGRDWLAGEGVDLSAAYPVDVIAELELRYVGGFEEFWTDVAAEKAARRLGRFDYADVIRKARAA